MTVEKADGLTISGGEPFEQFPELLHLLNLARCVEFRDILVYTGYTIKELEELFSEKFKLVKELVSAIVDGPYIQELKTDLIWKGSDNQQLHIFDSNPEIVTRYERFKEQKKDKHLQMVMRWDNVFIIGIP
ncbi:4Fe-4S cluster-binding domain-containing protein [Fervidobacterium thailandense]